jgi:anti-anti-sigma factor
MEPTTEPKPGVPMIEVVVTEDFDRRSVPRVSALLEDALALRPRELVVDLTMCPFLDAAAIGLLLDVHRRAHRASCTLTLRSPSDRLQRNLKLARADRVLRVDHPSQPSQKAGEEDR